MCYIFTFLIIYFDLIYVFKRSFWLYGRWTIREQEWWQGDELGTTAVIQARDEDSLDGGKGSGFKSSLSVPGMQC